METRRHDARRLAGQLAKRQALIMHFSAHAVMRAGLDFPTDLQQCVIPGPCGPVETVAHGPTSLDDVPTAFPGQPIWTMTTAGPRQL